MEHGALDYKECVGDDLKAEGVTFPKTLGVGDDHTVVFSWIVYASKAERTRILKKVLADPRMAKMMDPKNSPFDLARMLYGGFNVIVDMAPAKAPAKAKKKAPAKKAAKKKKTAR
jgi:uncharacterized protein YbaA (DUF1428 family)